MIEKEQNIKLAELLRIPGQKHVFTIVGGIGPFSHTDFERNIIEARTKWLQKNSQAVTDQSHPGYQLLNLTRFPDRTVALEEERRGNPSQAEEVHKKIVQASLHAEREGMSFITFICNTIHNWHLRVKDELPIPWIHMPQVTARHIADRHRPGTKIGILATNGTIKGGLYHEALSQYGLTPVSFDLESGEQQLVMDAIYHPEYGVKATGSTIHPQAEKNLIEASNRLRALNAQVAILGCTELPMIRPQHLYNNIEYVDPMVCLAQTVESLAMGRTELDTFRT